MSAKLAAKIELHAGGGWEGHTFFVVRHPFLNDILGRSNSIESVKSICEEHGLCFDSGIIDVLKNYLIEDGAKGFLVPRSALREEAIISSAQEYLRKVQTELF